MSDLDSRLEGLVSASPPPDVSDLERLATRRRSQRRRRASALGAVVLLAGGVTVWQLSGDDPTVTQVVTSQPTAPPTSLAADSPIREPIIEHEWCDRTTTPTWGFDGDPPEDPPTRIYAESVAPIAVQIIGRSDELPDRYTVVLRVPNDGFQTRSWGASVEPTGVGHARTVLDDGTALYFRSRGIDQAELAAIMANAVPRPLDAPVPGVDLTRSATDQILAEEDGLSWAIDGSTSSCQHDYGGSGGPAEVHVSVWDGQMASVLAFALDAPAPILMRLQSDGTLLRMWGAPLSIPDLSGATMTLDEVVEGDVSQTD